MLLSSSPTLTIRRPSPTTVEFTVSNAAPLKSASTILAFTLLTLARFLAAFFSISLVVAKWTLSTDGRARILSSRKSGSVVVETDWIAALATLVMRGPFGQIARNTASRIDSSVVLAIVLATTWIVLRRGYTEESLLVLRGLGIQTSTTSPSYLGSKSSRFIPTNLVQDILIHEAFRGFEVKFYLAAVVKGEGSLVVVFPNLLPNRRVLENVWRGARDCLYES